MCRKKKILLWISGGLTILLIFLIVLVPVTETYLNREPVIRKIQETIALEIEGSIEFQKIDLFLFRRPHIGVHQVRFSIPEKVSGDFKSLKIYPAIIPLLTGNLRISGLFLEEPNAHVRMRPGKAKQQGLLSSLSSNEETIGVALGALRSKFQNLVVEVQKGRIDLVENRKSVFQFWNVNALCRLDDLEIDLRCESNLWEEAEVKGKLDPQDLTGKGQVDLTRFQPQVLTNYLYPQALQGIKDSEINLAIDFQTKTFKVTKAECQGTLPYLSLFKGDRQIAIKGKRLNVSYQADKTRTTIFLRALELEEPRLILSGNFVANQSLAEISSSVRLEVLGKEIDVQGVREVMLALGGDNTVVQTIFDIFQGGDASPVRFTASADSLTNLGKLDNLTLEGNLIKGKIWVPGVHLNLEQVKGRVMIADGILTGEGLEARLGNTTASEGVLRLGLTGDDAPFHLGIGFQADLSQVPAILKRIIKDKQFQKAIDRVSKLKGTAIGHLVLGDRLDSIGAKVDVRNLQLTANYHPLPYPLEIDQGQFLYEGREVVLQDLVGKVRGSSFSKFSAKIDWTKVPFLEISAGKADIQMVDMHACFSLIENLQQELKTVNSIKGTLRLDDMKLQGPLLEPQNWHFQIDGEAKNLMLDAAFLPGPLRSKRAKLGVTAQVISIETADAKMLDMALYGSALINGYIKKMESLNFKLQGVVGQKANQWIAAFFKVPQVLTLRPHLISKAHLTWDNSGKTTMDGKIGLQEGPQVSGNVVLDKDGVHIKGLLIQDNESNAAITFKYKNNVLDTSFKGNLTKNTLDRLYRQNQLLAGWLKGDWQAHISLKQPLSSSFQGQLWAKDLHLPEVLERDLKINDIAVTSQEKHILIESSDLTWGESHLEVIGSMDFSPEAILLNMAAAADEFDLDPIEAKLKKNGNTQGAGQHKNGRLPPVRGTLKIKTERFKYADFIWNQLRGEVNFSAEEIDITISEANLCGVTTQGGIKILPVGIQLNVKPSSKNQDLNSSLNCLLQKDVRVQGRYNFEGEATGQGHADDLLQSLHGNLDFYAENGRIYKLDLLARIFAVLNVFQVFKGKLPELTSEGFEYNYWKLHGTLKNGQMVLDEMVLDGTIVKITSEGSFDLQDQTLDLIVLVAPLKAADRIVNKVPVFSDIMGGVLIAIPVAVRGKLKNPNVLPLGPGAVGSRLMGIMQRTVKVPVKMIDSVLPAR
jgi:hypothetical protein